MKHLTLIIVCLVCLIASNAYAQDSSVVKHKQDSLKISLEKKFWESGKEKTNSMFFSAATGYAKVISDNKYNGLWVSEASFGTIFTNRWVLGIRFEFWKSTYNGYVSPGVYTDVDFNGSGFNIIGAYKANFEKNRISLNGGLGIGNYVINNGAHMSLSALLGLSYYPMKFLSIDSKNSFNFIFGLKEGARAINLLNIKLGITLYTFY